MGTNTAFSTDSASGHWGNCSAVTSAMMLVAPEPLQNPQRISPAARHLQQPRTDMEIFPQHHGTQGHSEITTRPLQPHFGKRPSPCGSRRHGTLHHTILPHSALATYSAKNFSTIEYFWRVYSSGIYAAQPETETTKKFQDCHQPAANVTLVNTSDAEYPNYHEVMLNPPCHSRLDLSTRPKSP